MQYKDQYITDYHHKSFQKAFRMYFEELDTPIKNWDGLFAQLTSEGDPSILREDGNGSVIGFILFGTISMKSWFFDTRYGFIREHWISPGYRRQGHGADLLKLAEACLRKQDISQFILTTDTAEDFYLRQGYRKDTGIAARNNSPVFTKALE